MRPTEPSRLITGAKAQSTNVLAQCHCQTHLGYLTKKLMDDHNCLNKNCCFFKKLPHPYWDQLKHSERKVKKQNLSKKRKK